MLARFIQPDPLDPSLPGVDVNRYAYAGNNPIGYVDPSGLRRGHVPGDPNNQLSMDHVHFGLDMAGMMPVLGEPADVVNGAIYAAEGDYGNSALSFGGALPGVGTVVTAGKYAAKHGDEVVAVVRQEDNAVATGSSVAKALEGGSWVKESTAGWSARAKAYQEQVTGRPVGDAFKINGVKFDGVLDDGDLVKTLIEAKSPGYGSFIDPKTGAFRTSKTGNRVLEKLLNQARKQRKAAPVDVDVKWVVGDERFRDALQKQFDKNRIDVEVIHVSPNQTY